MNPIEASPQQLTIKHWFDETYRSKGENYLRNKEAYLIFAELLKLKTNDLFLDIACGLGRMLEVAQDRGAIAHGIDISDVAVTKAKLKLPQAKIVAANAEDIPFASDEFDAITCLGSLERMLDKNQVLSEIKRVSKVDAKFCFMVRNSHSWRWVFLKKMLSTINKKGHQDAKTYSEWKKLFNENGFIIEQCIPDQWPSMWLRKKISLGRFKQFSTIQPSLIPLYFANEFIFILKKS